MSLGEGYPKLGLPRSHYFLSLSRGDAIRTIMLRPAGLFALAALAVLIFAWAAAATAYVAFHDDLMGAMIARQVQMKSLYERRLAEAGARLDEAASRRELDLKSFASKLSELASRQARLEKRGAVVAALAETESRNHPAGVAAANALGAIQALAPAPQSEASPVTVPAYAPLPASAIEFSSPKPHPIDEGGGAPAG